MGTALTVKQLKHQTWAVMVREQAESGLAVRDWCRQNGIGTKAFYYRRKLVQEEALRNAPDGFVELCPPPHTDMSAFESGGFTPQLTISLNGASIGVNESTQGHLLREVLGVIRDA